MMNDEGKRWKSGSEEARKRGRAEGKRWKRRREEEKKRRRNRASFGQILDVCGESYLPCFFKRKLMNL